MFFLSIAAKKKYVIDRYVNNPVGVMEKDKEGKTSMTNVSLRPQVMFSGVKPPTYDRMNKIHHLSHEQCFLANSVKTQIVIKIIA